MLELREEGLDLPCKLLPEDPSTPKRRKVSNGSTALMAGIVCMLNNGEKRKDLPEYFGKKSSVDRAIPLVPFTPQTGLGVSSSTLENTSL